MNDYHKIEINRLEYIHTKHYKNITMHNYLCVYTLVNGSGLARKFKVTFSTGNIDTLTVEPWGTSQGVLNITSKVKINTVSIKEVTYDML